MSIKKEQHQKFEEFFNDPTKENLRAFLEGEDTETRYTEFKESWPIDSKIAKEILSFANSNSGVIIIGVKENADGTFTSIGLEKLKDQADYDNGTRNYIPENVSHTLVNFSYKNSGKSFQVIFVEHLPEIIPVISKQGEARNIQEGIAYIRKNTKAKPASYQEFVQLLDKRIRRVDAVSDLKVKLSQIKELRRQLSNAKSSGLLARNSAMFKSLADDQNDLFLNDCIWHLENEVKALLGL